MHVQTLIWGTVIVTFVLASGLRFWWNRHRWRDELRWQALLAPILALAGWVGWNLPQHYTKPITVPTPAHLALNSAVLLYALGVAAVVFYYRFSDKPIPKRVQRSTWILLVVVGVTAFFIR